MPASNLIPFLSQIPKDEIPLRTLEPGYILWVQYLDEVMESTSREPNRSSFS